MLKKAFRRSLCALLAAVFLFSAPAQALAAFQAGGAVRGVNPAQPVQTPAPLTDAEMDALLKRLSEP